jgi:hypothetical protein
MRATVRLPAALGPRPSALGGVLALLALPADAGPACCLLPVAP